MKRFYLLLPAMLLMLLPTTLKAQDIVLEEGFENGMPAGWTQESVTGQTLWAVESGAELSYPSGAYGSGKSRAYLRNATGQTLGFKTRLITPVMNIESAKNADGEGTHGIYQPILRFSHAQAKWTADHDTLRVYYRTSQDERARWTLLREYTNVYSNWVREEIELPQANTTYQLAFEGSENMGRGIVLDSVVVRSKPECTTPHDLELFNMVDGGVDLQWLANYDSYAFQFVVMKGEALEYDIDTVDLSNSPMVVYNQTVDFAFGSDWVYRVTGLEGGTTYTAYIRSLCEGGEYSDWASITFNMKNVKRIPYYESFDLPLKPGHITKLSGWVMAANTGNFNPFVCTNLSGADARLVTRSGTSLVFTGANNAGNTARTEIPAGTYVYAATPELTGADLKDCQVRFWMSLGPYGCMSDMAQSIIVGVMTDPQDLETFEAIETVSAWKYATFEEHVVSLENSLSGGKFVAFLSYFDKPNQLYIEDMTIELQPSVKKVQGVSAVPVFSGSTMNYKVKWESIGASKYNVLVATVASETPDSIAADKVVKTYTLSTLEQQIAAADINNGQTYYAYVQGVEGDVKGEWSNAYEFTVPCQRAIPMLFGFEPEDGETQQLNSRNLRSYYMADCVQSFSTDPEYPYTYKGTSTYLHTTTGKGVLCLSKDANREAWVVFPPVSRIDTMEMEFFMRAYSTSYYGRAIVGVMSDPQDLTTFEPVQVFENNTATYMRCVTSFAAYEGEGKFIAIRWKERDDQKDKNNYMLIDDVEIRYQGDCVIPADVEAEPTTSSASITWVAPRMETWDIIVSSAILTDDQQDNEKYMTNVIKRENNLKQTQYSVSGLEWGTPYYIYVRSVCDREADDGVSLWSSPTEFTTKVPNPMPLPYKEEFDRWGSSSTNGYKLPAQGLENGWQKVSAGNYPYLTTTNYSSPASLYLYNFQGATTALSSRCGYAIAPLLATQDLTDVKVSFFGRAVTAATTAEQAASCYVDTLYIGAMTDPKDSTTFTLLKEVSVPTTTFKEYNVVLDNWAPSYGNYIAFTTAHAWSPRATNPTTGATGTIYNSLYIDDVIFSIYTDSKPLSLETTDVQGDNVSVSWSGRASDGWTIVVATKEINPDTVSATTSGVVLKDTAIASTVFDYKIENLTPQTWYYIYLKPTKGKEWSSISAMTLCLPLTPTKSFMMDFEYLGDSAATAQTKYVPDCWTAYNESNTTTASYIPGIYRYSTTASITATSYCRPGGRKSMHVYTYIPATATATSAGPAVFATPEIKVNDMASLYVSFWYKAQSNTYTFGLGVMKDPDDFSTYTELAVIYPGNTNWNQYEYVLGDLGYKPEMGKYVAWVADLHLDKSTARYAGGYIDDIQMYEQTCKAPQVNISQISDTSAIVMTGLPSSSVITYTLFKDTVVDALVLNDPDSGSVYMQKMVAAGKVAQADTLANGAGQILHDLEESTDYTIALQMLCDEGATSVYVLNTFTTQCAAKPLSYFEKIDFERITIDGKEVNIYNDTTYNSTTATWAGGARPIECWMLGNKAMDPSNKTAGFVPYVVRRTATQTNTTIVPSDWNALRLYSTTTYNGAYAIMPTLDVDDIRNYQVSFKGRANGGTALTKSALTTYAGGIIVGIVSDASDLSTFMALDTLYVQDTAVHKMVVRFDKYKGDADGNMGRQIAFMSEFAKTNVFVIDDITVSEASSGCQIPLHLRANPNVYDAELSWESSADSFYVYIANEVVAYDKWDTYAKWLAVKKTDKESVFVDGLQGSKPYYAYIKAVCQDTAQWALDPLYFKTECPESLMLPYEENFDSYATGGTSHPDCWDVYYNNYNLIDNPTSTIYPYVYSTAHYGTSGNGMYFYYYGTYNTPERRATAATPRIGGKINQTMVSFVYRNSSTTAISSSSDYTGYLIVGFASETSTLDTLLKTFVPIDTIAVKPYNGADAVWHEYVRELSDVSGENMHLVLATYNPWGTSTTYHAGQGGSIYLDNLKVEKIPTCFTPSVESVSNVTFETCDVSVSPAKEKDTKWDLMIVSGDEKDTVMVTDTLTVIPVKGLKNGTTYTVYARTNCGDGDVSAWSAGLDFNTQKLITDSAFYGFENTERTTLIPTSTSDSYVIHPDLSVQNISKAGTYATSYSYIPYNYSNSATITYSRTGEAALRMYNCFSTTATSCWTNAYVKLPQIENAQNKQLSFDMRAGYAGGDTILETNQYYRMAELEIGMIDADATDVSSYETLASFKMSPLYLHEKAINANNRLFDHIVFPLPEKLTVNKKLVLRNIGTEATSYIYLDNLTIEPKKQNVATPKFKSSAVSATTLTLNWDKNGAEKWNVYVVDADAAINFPLDSVAASDIVADKKDVTDTTVTFSGLTPGKKYYAYLQLAGESGIGATSIRRPEIMPLSEKIAVTDTIDFESGLVSLFGPTAAAADSAYLTLPGWYMGNKRYNGRAYQGDVHTYGTYYSGNTRSTTYQYMRYSHNKNTSADKDKNALRLYNGTTTGYNGAYAVMPMIDCDQLDTLQLNFWARPFWGTSVETAPKVGAATSTAPQRPLIVGTVTDPNDISTFEEIQRFTYSDLSLTTSTNLFENEDLWYDEFAISLAGTEGKYIAFLNDTIGYWFIDDISFGPATCFTPAGLKSSDVTNKSAVLSWKTFVDSKSRIQVATSGTYASNAIAIDTLVAEGVNSITVSGLEGSTRYVWHVRSECGGELGNSKWTSDGEFDTGCPAVGSGTKYSFEAAEGLVIRKGATSATYSIPNCWRADGTYTTKSSTYIPYVVSSSGTTWYSHASDALSGTETNLNGMYFYNSQSYLGTSTYYRSWAVTPEISGDIQDMQVSFYMLPNSYNPQTQLLAGAATTANYTSVVVVGLLSDPDDMSTFIPVDTLVYDRVNPTQSTPATPENDYMWQKMTVNFENVKETDAHFICFVGDANIAMEVCAEKLASYLETTSSWYVYNRFYIDDISIETKSECIIPSNVKASNILKDAAMITWESEGKADIVAVYTSAQLTESTLVVRDTVANDTLEIFDLEPFTNYYVTVQAICAEDMESDPSQTYEFHTLRVPKVAETFMTNIRIPADWESGTGRAEDVFAGTADIVPATTYAWYHGTALDGLVYPHQYMYMYSTTTLPTDATLDSAYLGSTYQKFGWMITPSVVLDDEHDAWLTFTGFMSGYGSVDGSPSSSTTIYRKADLNGKDDQFMVIVSDDNGETWKRENAIIWNNETGEDNGIRVDGKDRNHWYGKGDYSLSDLAVTKDEAVANPIRVDLSKYKGKTIKVAFYVENTLHNARNYMRISHLNLNYYVVEQGTLTNCQYEEFDESQTLGFAIDEDRIASGAQHFERIVYAPALDADLSEYTGSFLDSLYVLDAEVLSAPTYVINATICEGEEYSDNNFIPRMESGTYKQKGVCTETGCDSITVLNLTVIPRQYTVVEDTICEGQAYQFNGKEYLTRTITSDTLTSVVTGCDSIVTLFLEVVPALKDERTVQICSSNTYYMSEKYPALDQSGHYVDTIKNVDGCNVVIDLNLTVYDTLYSSYEVTTCAGTPVIYEGQTFTEAGVYPVYLKSAAGCDSLVTLTVNVTPVYLDTLNIQICNGETYPFNGLDISVAGEYKETVSSINGCDSTTVLVLDVLEKQEHYVDTVINESDLPYFYGDVTYPIGTEPGVYEDTITDAGVCGGVLYHKLTIISETGIDNLKAKDLRLTPSVINRDETVAVSSKFTSSELKGMRIDVYDMTGKQVMTTTEVGNPIEIDCFHVSGLYNVRITTGTQQVYIGRVVVR